MYDNLRKKCLPVIYSGPQASFLASKQANMTYLKIPSICNILSPVSRRPRKVLIIGRPAPTVAS